MFNSLQHARPPCPSSIPVVYSDSCPLSRWCHPIILSFVVPFFSHLQSFPALGSFQMLFASDGQSIGSFSFNISPSNEYSGLISFRMDWLDLLAVQGTLKSLLQHHSSKASILWHSAFFIVQLSHPYMTTGKTLALTRRTFVFKVMSLHFNKLSRSRSSLFFQGGMGQQWPAAGLEALSVAVQAWDLLKEVTIIFITSISLASGQITGRKHSPTLNRKLD